MTITQTDRLQLVNITKAFPGVLANDKVNFSVKPGEIHALLGENGAGKSTLVKMIYGVLAPDSGDIVWNGQSIDIPSPRVARKLGIGMVFQHFSLFEAMTVLENIALGRDDAIPQRKLDEEVRAVLDRYQLNLDPRRIVSTLSVGERQRIEIVRALLLDPRLLIMDEPTSVLTPQEVEQLFGTLRKLAAGGCSILYISHKLHEIVELCDRATILRGGKVVGACDPRAETPRSMGEMMIGGEFGNVSKAGRPAPGAARLEARGLSLPKRGDFEVALDDIRFEVRAGEIFGIAGVAGNGQIELMEALSGERLAATPDAFALDGAPIGALGPNERRARGLCALPEERNGHAAIGEFTLAENAILTARARKGFVSGGGLIDAGKARQYAAEVISTFGVKAQGPGSTAGSLSGGNLQKFIVGREIMQAPGALAISQPTWGVDAGAAATIHQALVDLASSGAAILVISQDLDELLALCDRLAVINLGRLSTPRAVAETTVEELGLLMGGAHGAAASAAAEVAHAAV